MEELERLRESIKQLLVEGRDERLSDLVEDAHPADVSRVIRELPRDDQVRLFRLLSPQHAGEVLAELDDPTLRPDKYTIRSVLGRIEEKGDLFAALLGADQRLPRLT